LLVEYVKGNFTPKPLTEPYVNLSIHTALIMQSTDGRNQSKSEIIRIFPGPMKKENHKNHAFSSFEYTYILPGFQDLCN